MAAACSAENYMLVLLVRRQAPVVMCRIWADSLSWLCQKEVIIFSLSMRYWYLKLLKLNALLKPDSSRWQQCAQVFIRKLTQLAIVTCRDPQLRPVHCSKFRPSSLKSPVRDGCAWWQYLEEWEHHEASTLRWLPLAAFFSSKTDCKTFRALLSETPFQSCGCSPANLIRLVFSLSDRSWVDSIHSTRLALVQLIIPAPSHGLLGSQIYKGHPLDLTMIYTKDQTARMVRRWNVCV